MPCGTDDYMIVSFTFLKDGKEVYSTRQDLGIISGSIDLPLTIALHSWAVEAESGKVAKPDWDIVRIGENGKTVAHTDWEATRRGNLGSRNQNSSATTLKS